MCNVLNFNYKSSIRHSRTGAGEVERRQKNIGYRKWGYNYSYLLTIKRCPRKDDLTDEGIETTLSKGLWRQNESLGRMT